MKISVAMAVYNGEIYLEEQLCSVLGGLHQEDEVVVSADPSDDGTDEILRRIAGEDSRVRILKGPGKGVSANFQNALFHTSGDLIFLCDQDDFWLPEKVETVRRRFEEKDGLVLLVHDAVMTDENLKEIHPSYFEFRGSKPGILKNLWKNSFIGCCMAFKKELKPYILPFPEKLPMHDQWIGLAASSLGKVEFLPQKLLCYRRHGQNASEITHAGAVQMLRWRGEILLAYLRRKRGKLS